MTRVNKEIRFIRDKQESIEASLETLASSIVDIVEVLERIAYNQRETLAAPVIAFANNSVTITSADSATIRYTLDGTEPNEESSVYSEAIAITTSKVVKARCFKLNKNASAVASQECTPIVAAPSISCSNNSVTMTCATAGAAIHYTSDGSTPTASSALYESAIAITETKTFKAIAVKAGWENSSVTSKECTHV